MSRLDYKCPLCQSYLIPNPSDEYTYNCSKCHRVEFVIAFGEWHIQTYRFNDPEVFSLSFNLILKTACIQLSYRSAQTIKQQIIINEIWPDTQAVDALHLAKRLLNLKTFY